MLLFLQHVLLLTKGKKKKEKKYERTSTKKKKRKKSTRGLRVDVRSILQKEEIHFPQTWV